MCALATLATLVLAAADDNSCLLQRKVHEPVGFEQAEAREVTCPEGTMEYTFSGAFGWAQGAYNASEENAAPGVRIISTSAPSEGAGNCVNREGEGAAVNSQNILIFEADEQGSGVACQTATGRASITLRFQEPQTISAFTVTTDGGLRNDMVFLTLVDELEPLEYDIPNNGNEPNLNRVLTITPPVARVQSFKISLGGPVGLNSVTFCRFRGSLVGGSGPPPSNAPASASLVGDPHIHTLDGSDFSLLQQGTFSAWQLKGLPSYPGQATVDWDLLAHYSGHLSFTRGLLLLDTSGRAAAAEITSESCQLKARKGKSKWRPVRKMRRISTGPTELRIMQLAAEKRTLRWTVHLLKGGENGTERVATLRVRCIPGHHINAKIDMDRKEDISLVQGQMGTRRPSFSALQLEKAKEEDWQDLGGSAEAFNFLKITDEEASPALLQTCSQAEKDSAAETCAKYFGEHSDFFQDCIFDVCSGGGEEAAQLAAEIERA